MTFTNRVKLFVAGVLALLVLVIVLQNTEEVETRLLFITLTMPRAVLLFGTTAIGFLIGVLWSMRLTRSSN